MQQCPRCGSPAADGAPACPLCGQALAGARPAAAPPTAPVGKQTMIGLPGAPNQMAAAPAPAAPPLGSRTMLGMPMTGSGPQPAPAPGPANLGKQTMIGMASPFAAQQPMQQPAQQPMQQAAPPGSMHRTMLGISPQPMPQQAAPAQQPAPQAAAAPPSAHRTMLGVALPGIAPVYPPAGGQAPPQPAPASMASAHRTMLGVAVPGIAPVRPDPYAQPPPMAQPQVMPQGLPPAGNSWYQDAPHTADVQNAPLPAQSPRVVVPRIPFYRRVAFFVVMLGLFVAVAVALFAVFWPTSAPITAEAAIDDKGADLLKVKCPKCADGTTLTVEGATGTIAGGAASIPLSRPLAVGDNRFRVAIDRPGTGRDETVDLVMPVAYRLKPDLSTLQQPQPAIRIDVEAKPGTVVEVDGKAVTLGADGKGSHLVDVSADCEGSTAEVKLIDRALQYVVKPRGGTESKGTITVKVGVTPLAMQSPKVNSVIADSNFLVAGRTSPNAIVEIEGTKFAAGPDGRFSRKVQMKSAGVSEIRVRATAAEQAPRTVLLKVKRVDDIEAEARSFTSSATVTVPALFGQTDEQKGKAISLEGEVFELRQQGFERIVLLDVGSTCGKAPCLVRLVDASGKELSKGTKVRVFGYVTGAYTPPDGKPAPEVDVAFLLTGKGAGR